MLRSLRPTLRIKRSGSSHGICHSTPTKGVRARERELLKWYFKLCFFRRDRHLVSVLFDNQYPRNADSSSSRTGSGRGRERRRERDFDGLPLNACYHVDGVRRSIPFTHRVPDKHWDKRDMDNAEGGQLVVYTGRSMGIDPAIVLGCKTKLRKQMKPKRTVAMQPMPRTHRPNHRRYNLQNMTNSVKHSFAIS